MKQAEINELIKRKKIDFGLLERAKNNVSYNINVKGTYRLLNETEYKAVKSWYERINVCLDM